jgi:anti-sigma regulatory factor (Ser/Thr protein kinase)
MQEKSKSPETHRLRNEYHRSEDMPLKEQFYFTADTKHLVKVREIIARLWKKEKLNSKEGRLVALAVDEALTSIIRHAQGMKRAGDISIKIYLDEVCFKTIIKDNPNAFDFSALTEKEKMATLIKEKQYQLGVFLISTIMDEINYRYLKGFQNELQLTRFLDRKLSNENRP